MAIVMTRAKRDWVEEQMRRRFNILLSGMEPRDLTDDSEGCSNKRWDHPEQMCAIRASRGELRIALADFRTVLNEMDYLKR